MHDVEKGRQYPCEQVVPIEQEPRHHLVIANEFVRAFAVEIAPHDRTLCHHHPHDYLMYVACIADIVSAPRQQEPETYLYRDEECVLSPAGMTHVVANLAGTPFRNVVVEFLPPAGDLRRRPSPQVMGGDSESSMDRAGTIARVRVCFDDPKTASIYVVSVQRGEEVEICGPAVMASPYQQEVALRKADGETAILCEFRDLAWLAPGGKGVLQTTGAGAARVVVFQVGAVEPELPVLG